MPYKNGKEVYNKKIFTLEELKDIKESYVKGESSVSIGKRYGTSHKPILRELHDMGVNVDQKKTVRKYYLDEHYFDNIDTPNKAYVLGFLHSDGSNFPNKSTISLSLQEEDIDILEKIRKELKSEKPLEFLDYSNKHDFGYNYKNQYRLIMFSKHMCNQLSNKGIIQNKSLVIGFPNWLDSDLLSHYIRGVYDGDGSICRCYRNDNNKPIIVTITATNSFCITLKNICSEILGINSGIYDASCHNGITKVFTISGRNVVKVFLDWIYKDADLFLQRKYNRYCEYYNINNSLSV